MKVGSCDVIIIVYNMEMLGDLPPPPPSVFSLLMKRYHSKFFVLMLHFSSVRSEQ